MPFRYELTLNHRNKIMMDYTAGKPLKYIATAQGVSVSVIRRVLREMGIIPLRKCPSHRKLSEEQRAAIIEMRRNGKTLQTIAEEFGVTPTAIFFVEANHYAATRCAAFLP